jgi:hypothetical protein
MRANSAAAADLSGNVQYAHSVTTVSKVLSGNGSAIALAAALVAAVAAATIYVQFGRAEVLPAGG